MMLYRAFFWGIGLFCALAGGISSLAYLNMLTTGHNLSDYFLYLIHRPEFYLLPIGLLMITCSIYQANDQKDE